LIGLKPDHASLYLLELYPNAPLKDEMVRGGWRQEPDEVAAEMYNRGLDWFEAAGYHQYEISNVAKNGHESRHNLKYWSGGAWIGFGCGAHSTKDRRRWQNVSDVELYIKRVKAGLSPVVSQTILSVEDLVSDTLFLGLRLSKGVDLPSLESRYRVDVWERWGQDLQIFVDAGLLHEKSDRLRLTRKGMLLANEVMSVFV
jgi:oxygen-independent coproporphyrinogen-3 oxidase